MMQATFRPVADFGLLVSFAADLSDEAHASVLALDRALAADMPLGCVETVPALVNLMLVFDPLVTDHATLQTHVETVLKDLSPTAPQGREVTINVCYDTPFAPDLKAVAQATALSTDAVINAHLSGDYMALMFGFAPGYGYLGGVPVAIQVPRKATPVRDVPAGSVIIAGPQCLVTTLKMPTGWSIIGRSPTQILTGNADAPTLFEVGDRIRFRRISADQMPQGMRND